MLSKFSAPAQVVVPNAGNLRDGIDTHYGICSTSCCTSARLTMSSPSSPTKSVRRLRGWRISFVTLWAVCPPAIAHATHYYQSTTKNHGNTTGAHTHNFLLTTLPTLRRLQHQSRRVETHHTHKCWRSDSNIPHFSSAYERMIHTNSKLITYSKAYQMNHGSHFLLFPVTEIRRTSIKGI